MFVYYKCFISIESTFLKVLMLIKQVHEKSLIFFTIDNFQTIVLSFNQMSAIDFMI